MTAALTAAAVLTGRGPGGCLLVAGTVACGQLTIGWINDVADADRDRRAGRQDKPVALGEVSATTVLGATAVATVALVPLSLANGVKAGLAHLGFVLGGWAYDVPLKRTVLSWLPYAVSFGLLPAFLSYGEDPGTGTGAPPTPAMTVLAALFGVGFHVLNTLPDLDDDEATGARHLPLRLARRTGVRPLLVGAALLTGGAALGMAVTAMTVGVRS